MSMMTNTLGRYFAGRFVVAAVGRVCEHLRAAGAGRLHRDGAQDLGPGFGLRHHGGGDVAVPRAAIAREADAVLRPDRRDDLLSRAVAAARTRGRARRRRLGLAVHRAGARQRASCSASWRPPPTIRCRRTCANSPSAWKRSCSARRPAAASRTPSGFWLNQINSDGQSIINAARSEQQGVRLTGLTVFRFDTDLQFKERIEAREASLEDGPLGVQIGAPILARQAADRPGHLLPRDHADRRPRSATASPPPRLCLFGNSRAISGLPRAPALPPPAIDCSTTSSLHSRFCWLRW